MEFTLWDLDHSIHDIMELTGYVSLGFGHDEFSLVKKMGKDEYPRFSLSIKILNGGDHGHHFMLCQENSSRPHDIIRDNPQIKDEAKRIKDSLMNSLE